MYCKLIILAIVTNVFSPNFVYADWQYTKWGMTRDQLLRSAPGKVESVSAGTSNDKTISDKTIAWDLNAPHQAAGVACRADFGFEPESGRLVQVRLTPLNSANCLGMKSALLKKYGKPETEDDKKDLGKGLFELDIYDARWKDKISDNTLDYSQTNAKGKTFCWIDYTPIGSANRNGL